MTTAGIFFMIRLLQSLQINTLVNSLELIQMDLNERINMKIPTQICM